MGWSYEHGDQVRVGRKTTAVRSERVPQVFFSFLMERQGMANDVAFGAAAKILLRAGARDYGYIHAGYERVDTARNRICDAFMAGSQDPDDVMIMFDADHDYPIDTIERLISHNKPVVSALAFRRCEPFDPQIYRYKSWEDQGAGKSLVSIENILDFEPGRLMEIGQTGFAAVAIRRSVLEKIPRPWFRFWYPQPDHYPGEDFYFCLECKRMNIPIFCDTSVILPHYATWHIDENTFASFNRKKLAAEAAANPGNAGIEQIMSEIKAKQEVPSAAVCR
jgi:hypothetical protein